MENKFNKTNILLISVSIIFALIAIVSLVLYKTSLDKPFYTKMKKTYDLEATKYSDVFKENESDILNYMYNRIDYVFLPMSVMDEMFRTCAPKFSEAGQDSLYTIYYGNWSNLAGMYQDLFDTNRYTYLIWDFKENNPDLDINDPKVYRTLPNLSLVSVIEELEMSHCIIEINGDYVEVHMDFQWFFDTYYDLMNEELREFVKLDILSNNTVSEDRTYIRLDILEDLIIQYSYFLDNVENNQLRYNALQNLRKALKVYLNCAYTYMLYDNTTDYGYDDDMFDVYETFISNNPNLKVTPLVEQALSIFKNEGGKGEPLDGRVAPLVDEWILNNGYASKDELQAISEMQDTIGEYTYVAEE